MRTIEANAADAHTRFGVVGSIVSECFSSTWSAEPTAPATGMPSISWIDGDGVSVSRALMPPIKLTNTCAVSPAKSRYYVSVVDQPALIRPQNRAAMRLQAGEVVFFSSSTPSEWVMSRPYETTSLIFDEDLIRQFLPDPEPYMERRLRLPVSFQASLKNLLDAAWDTGREHGFDTLGLQFARAFLQMFSVAAAAEAEPAKTILLPGALDIRRDQIIRFIRENYRDPGLSVGSVARHLGLTPRYVQLAFSGHDLTPSDFIRDVRLEASARMLADRSSRAKSITTICYECGYNSSAHFSTQFRTHFGMTPRDFRAANADR